MPPIQSYVIIDLETTGLPSTNYGETKITEISLISVLRKHFDDSSRNLVPRVVNKLTMCFHPKRFISSHAENITGLSNELLEEQGAFDDKFCEMLHNFILRTPQPVCLLAHNGYRFDFPLIQAHTKILGKPLPESILCADTLPAFRELKVVENAPPRHIPLDIMQPFSPPPHLNDKAEFWPEETSEDVSSDDLIKILDDIELSLYDKFEGLEVGAAMHGVYGVTPERKRRPSQTKPPTISKNRPPLHESLTSSKVRKRLDFDTRNPRVCRPSYSLEAVHQHLFSEGIRGAHSAEGDTFAVLRCITALGAPFHEWVQANHRKLCSILKMW